MKKLDLIFIVIGSCIFIFDFFYSMWWEANAPYCCIHICGQTTSTIDCLPGVLIVVFALIGLFFFITGFYKLFRNKVVK